MRNDTIITLTWANPPQMLELPARRIEIEGFEFLRLCIHDGVGPHLFKRVVSELFTGHAIARGKTDDEAIINARKKLQGHTKEFLLDRVKQKRKTQAKQMIAAINKHK